MAKLFGNKDDKNLASSDYKKNKKPSESQILISSLSEKWDESRNAKTKYTEIWDKNIDAYDSELFTNTNTSEYKSDIKVNYIFSTLETIKPIMLDNNPKILVYPKTQAGMENVQALEDLMKYEWEREDMSIKLYQAVTTSLQTGTAIFGVYWDGDDEDGLGNVDIKVINPYNIFPDPMATCMEDAEYIIYAKYINTNKLKSMFPKKEKEIYATSIMYNDLLSKNQDSGYDDNQTLVLEVYLKDYACVVEDTDEYDEDGNKIQRTVRKYPNGRIVTFCPDLHLILDDKKNPYEYSEFPLIMMKSYDVPFSFWGRGEVDHLISPQNEINELTNQIADNAKLTANMPWVLDKNAGIARGQIDNRPGLIIRKTPGTMVQRLQPPQMPIYVENLIDTLKRDMETISGVHDITQGRKPGSVTAANAIMALQEAAQARIRLKVKLMEYALKKLGKKWYDTIRQFWVTERYIRSVDEDHVQSFTAIDPMMLRESVEFDMVSGSTMPVNKPAMLEQLIRLAQTPAEDGMPMVDRESVLKFTELPNRKKVLERFAKQKEVNNQDRQSQAAEQMAQQQMMAEQNALLDQEKSRNQNITDEQIQEVIQLILQDPQMLQQIMMMAQGGQAPQGV